MPIPVGKSATAEVVVGRENFASTVGSGALEVFATPMLVALAERAAVACIADCLEEGQTSVGTRVELQHTAASLPGARVRATATVTAAEGRAVEFEVTAEDDAGQVGHGTHTRVVVGSARFLEKAAKRGQG